MWIVPGWHHSFHFQFVLVILSRSPPSCPRVSNSTVCDCRQLSAQGAKRRVGFEVSCQPYRLQSSGSYRVRDSWCFVRWLARLFRLFCLDAGTHSIAGRKKGEILSAALWEVLFILFVGHLHLTWESSRGNVTSFIIVIYIYILLKGHWQRSSLT